MSIRPLLTRPLLPGRRHRLRAGVVGSVAVALLLGNASAVLAAPAQGPTVSVVVGESLKPILYGAAVATGSGAETLRFYARTPGASTWNLLDGATFAGRTGTARLNAGLAVGGSFEYRAEHCDGTGCTTSAVKSGQVSPELGAGSRPGATRLPFTIGDAVRAQVDVGSGNLMVQVAGLTLPRVSQDLSVGAVYNSLPETGRGDPLASVPIPASTQFESHMGNGWRLSTGSAIYLRAETRSGAVVFYGPGGLTGAFTPINATTYTPPPGFKMDLTKTGTGWELFDHNSGQLWVFNSGGQLTSMRDRNNNTTAFTYGYNGGGPTPFLASSLTQITTDQGSSSARTLTVNRSGYTLTGFTQTAPAGSGLTTRSVTYAYTGGRLSGITDVLGRTTSFSYTGDFLTSVTAPGGAVTSFAYTAGRVTSVTQPTSTSGTNAVTRIDYPDASTVRVAQPNTDQAQGIGSVPRTTYTLTSDGQKLIASAVDPTGAARSATYTSFLDVASATDPAGTSSATYNDQVNGGESLTGLTGASGATGAFTYTGSDRATRYQPQTSVDGQNNTTTYTYNGAGNRTSAANASSATASVTYNTNGDGTITASTSVNNAVTTYSYDTNKQLTSITPPAGNTLTGRAYTYDAFGRIATYTSGRGITETYTYDAADRLTTITYSGTGSAGGNVTYTYNTPGWQTSRVDPSGTTTYTYDPLGRLASRKHSINDITVAYAYDRTGNIATETTTVPGVAGKTTTYTYDARNLATRMTLANGLLIDFAYDTAGRRTDTWQGTNAAHTTWDAHTTTTYNGSGQVTRVWTAKASNNNDRVSDLTYNYASPGPSTAGCTTAPPVNTVTDLRWSMTDNVTGQVTAYCYDRQNRLVSAVAAAAGATPAVDFRYTYDANGNRTQLTENGTITEALTHNSADEITSTGYTYDAAGNPTATPDLGAVQYSRDEQMTRRDYTSGGNAAGSSYVYAGTNQVEFLQIRISSTAGRTYTYGRTDANGLPQIAAFSSNLAAPTASNTAYIAHDPNGTPIALTAWTGQTHFYAEDGLGSTVALINQDGAYTADYNYDPNGEVTVTNPSGTSQINTYNPFRYAGGTYDYSSNLILFGQRWYDPTTGRFTQQDTLETIGDPSRSNRYEYAASNPTNYIDPTGRDFGDFLQGASTVLGVASLIPGPVGVVAGVASAATSVAAGIANGEPAGRIVGGAALAATSGLTGAAGAIVGASRGAQVGVGALYEGIGACYDYC